MRTKNKDKELNHRHFIGLRLTDVELDLFSDLHPRIRGDNGAEPKC